MSNLSFWKTISLVCVFCAVEVISSPAQTFTTLHSFSFTDGYVPQGKLFQATDGNFYGTTSWGGDTFSCETYGCGTVFSITPQGQLTTLHSFDNTDGYAPSAALVQATDGNFYGTTYFGGTDGAGVVFKMVPGGTLTTLYSFGSGGQDGGFPTAPLVQATDGNFYGTNSGGGVGGVGTVFKITPDDTLTTLHSFCPPPGPGCYDGDMPVAGLVQASDGNFYGTTSFGGTSTYCHDPEPGCGTVFKITPDGELTTLYSFCSQTGCPDGNQPGAGLVQGSDGNFYGTTGLGGTSSDCGFAGWWGDSLGCGTVFKITPGGLLTTLHSFDSTDGAYPGDLVQATDGHFYGTTGLGGTSNNCRANGVSMGCGTVFEITPAGTLTTLHYFDGTGTDGSAPLAGLVQATDGNFYGTTQVGGAANDGTIFSLGVGLGPFVATSPTSGQVGMPVVILGNNLTGATSVTFSGAAATFTVVSDTAIKATVPSGATSGKVQVTTPSGTLTSNVDFQVR